MEPDGKEVSYFPNGQLRSEMTYVRSFVSGKLPHGMTRLWHSNGVLAHEIPTKFGKYHGTVRKWDSSGKLLGEYQMEEGTGTIREWYPNGQLSSEISMLRGQFHGRQRGWYDDGVHAGDVYWQNGRKLSKKRYLELCKTDSSLPRYDDLATKSRRRKPTTANASAKPNVEERSQHEDFIARLLTSRSAEARTWLNSSPTDDAFNLGELPTTLQSLELVEEAYAAGAVKVIAVEIQECSDGQQNSGKLVIELPESKAKRTRVVAWANEQAELLGFDPEPDMGEKHLFVPLD